MANKCGLITYLKNLPFKIFILNASFLQNYDYYSNIIKIYFESQRTICTCCFNSIVGDNNERRLAECILVELKYFGVRGDCRCLCRITSRSTEAFKLLFCAVSCRHAPSSQDSVLLLFRPLRDPTIDFNAAPIPLPGVCGFAVLSPNPCG